MTAVGKRLKRRGSRNPLREEAERRLVEWAAELTDFGVSMGAHPLELVRQLHLAAHPVSNDEAGVPIYSTNPITGKTRVCGHLTAGVIHAVESRTAPRGSQVWAQQTSAQCKETAHILAEVFQVERHYFNALRNWAHAKCDPEVDKAKERASQMCRTSLTTFDKWFEGGIALFMDRIQIKSDVPLPVVEG